MKSDRPNRVLVIFFPHPLSEELKHRVAEHCFRFTPLVAVRSDSQAVFLDITRCRSLYSEGSLLIRVKSLLDRIGSHLSTGTHFAFARDAATALACARFSERNPSLLPLAAMSDFLSPFEASEEVFRAAEKMRKSLEKLGIENLGHFLTLPRASLASRFSKQGLQLFDRLMMAFHSGIVDAWPGYRPTEVLEQKADCFGIETMDAGICLDTVWFTLKTVLDRLARQIHARGLRVSRLEVRFHFSRNEKGEKESHSRFFEASFPIPVSGWVALFKILRIQIEKFVSDHPFEQPLDSLSVKVLDSVAGTGAQKDFFHKKEEEHEDFATLTERLKHRLGKDSVFYAEEVPCHRPESRWQKTPVQKPRKETDRMTPQGLTRKIRTARPARPSRLLKQPVRLTVLGDWLIAPQEDRWQTIDWSGPENISGEWWDDSFARSYYQVTAMSGDRLWVFREGKNSFFLHGYFD